jgi:nucleoside 2-deoxyribosyltransferase
MHIYISGPITGMPNGNREQFAKVAKALRDNGHLVVSPREINQGASPTWVSCMRNDLRAMMDCDSIILLEGYQNSKGAMLEMLVAASLGFHSFFMDGENLPDELIARSVT